MFLGSSGKLTIHKYTVERIPIDHIPRTRHTLVIALMAYAHDTHSVRWHCHGRVKSACDDADDGTAVREGTRRAACKRVARRTRTLAASSSSPCLPSALPCCACCLVLAVSHCCIEANCRGMDLRVKRAMEAVRSVERARCKCFAMREPAFARREARKCTCWVRGDASGM